ncbi:hypothetical protein [Arthrobacter sp. A2-55]|uniref:hypothetical protein n=1 Tax=Arthrobacter sp. A2-55 TaxID=2897337 RepID=UPI0021CDAC62|nr:hypothetical protein [Arthrobacter sp. A2-55]MCU6481324.1 hypothetical protein [Arthrobacter sp. A2-55]
MKELTETIAALAVGDMMSAEFTTPRYGQITVTGPIRRGLDKKTVSIASFTVSPDGKPTKALQSLSRITPESGA